MKKSNPAEQSNVETQGDAGDLSQAQNDEMELKRMQEAEDAEKAAKAEAEAQAAAGAQPTVDPSGKRKFRAKGYPMYDHSQGVTFVDSEARPADFTDWVKGQVAANLLIEE